MSDEWYYADKERSVGPVSLQELKNALQKLPNWKEAMVWRAGYDGWRKAAGIGDLDRLEATPPPMPSTHTSAGQSPYQRPVGSELPTGMSRTTVLLIVGSYFLAAFAFALFIELRSPAAADGLTYPFAFGAGFVLFFVSSLIPIVVWAFQGFRVEKARGPLYAWLVLLFTIGLLFAFGRIYEQKQREQIRKEDLGGDFREEFIVSARRSCITTQRREQINRQAKVSDTHISAYCHCYATGMADNMTLDELVSYAKSGKPSEIMQKKLDDLRLTCIRALSDKKPSEPARPIESAQPTETTVSGQNASYFVAVKLPRGIALDLPRGWWLIGPDLNRQIETSSQAALDLSNIGLAEGKTTNLIGANSMPRSTYASVRLDSTVPPPATVSDISALVNRDFNAMQNLARADLLKTLPLQGYQLLDFYSARIEKISGHPSVVTEYRRTSPIGPVIVQINRIFTAGQEISVNLTYRESEAALWKPVIAKIRQSIVVGRWP